MTKPAIVVTGILPDPVNAALDAAYETQRVNLRHNGKAALLAMIGDARAIVVIPGDPVDSELIASLPAHVGLIASYSTGLDHVDLVAAKARGICVTNTPDVLTDATADVAMLLLLGALRGAACAIPLIQTDSWVGWQPAQIFGWDVKGRTLGIFGGGRIGAATARRARAFGLAVTYHSRSHSVELDALGGRYIKDRDAFWGSADIVSLHAPSSEETRNIVNADSLAKMRYGSFLINTARGDLVDDEAVLAALKLGKLAGIGFDVFRGEPAIHPGYRGLPNAFILPHIGSATHETRVAMGQSVLTALAEFFQAS